MLRLKVLVSVVPLLAAALLARAEFSPKPRPCLAVGAGSYEIASAPWHADLHVSFTDDPALATARVALSDDAATADFAVVDDSAGSEDATCEATSSTQFVAINAHDSPSAPVIYLAHGGPADYRIFVHSKRLTAREAAALVVSAHDEPPRTPAMTVASR